MKLFHPTFLNFVLFFRKNQIDKNVVSSLYTIKHLFLSFVPSMLCNTSICYSLWSPLLWFYNYFIFPDQMGNDLNWFLCLYWFPWGCILYAVLAKPNWFIVNRWCNLIMLSSRMTWIKKELCCRFCMISVEVHTCLNCCKTGFVLVKSSDERPKYAFRLFCFQAIPKLKNLHRFICTIQSSLGSYFRCPFVLCIYLIGKPGPLLIVKGCVCFIFLCKWTVERKLVMYHWYCQWYIVHFSYS